MNPSHQALDKDRQSLGDFSESLRGTACDRPLGTDTIQEQLPRPVAADESAQSSASYSNQISKELCRLHQACWTVLREPLHAAMTFRLALCAMETVCHLEGGNAVYLMTLAIAQYRLGQYEGALATLAQADRLIPGTPTSLAFQAMSQYHLGAIAQARTLLARLQQVIQQPPSRQDAEAHGFLREAHTLIDSVKSTK